MLHNTVATEIPVSLRYTSRASKELFTGADCVPPAVPKGQRPTARARRMANALWLEGLLLQGTFPSLTAARNALGLTKALTDQMFKMLDLPPEEMERILFETY